MRAIFVTLFLVAAAGASYAGPRYRLTDFGPIGPGGQIVYVAPNGLAAGTIQHADNTDHATLFYGHQTLDISSPGLGGQNSIANGVNVYGTAVGGAETGKADPGKVDFCGFQGLGLSVGNPVCAPFIRQFGQMKSLLTLGGNNGMASQINSTGVIAGEVENSSPDPGCPQRFQSKPVKWRGGSVVPLATYPGDIDGIAYAINEAGQIAGSTGVCAPFNPTYQLSIAPMHIMLWEPDGSPEYLGSLGGTGTNPQFANLAININNKGQVVGTSALAGDQAGHAFFWTKEKGMRDLGTLPGDFQSGAAAINDAGQIAGISVGPDGPSAFLWQNGSMKDLNDLVGPTPLHLLLGTGINTDGEIVGLAVDTTTGDVHGFAATPLQQDDGNDQDGDRQYSRDDLPRVLEHLRPLSRHGIRFTAGW